jgi:DNA-binding transcriptional regulator YhcF (GntR family)
MLVLRGVSGTIGERFGVRLWFAHSSEVPIYRQLVTQVVLAILCGDLKPGDRLPSTRELARRFALHPNTVSAGYRQLEQQGWTERRRGSGVYVRANADPPSTPEQILDHHIAGFFRAVRELGLPAADVRARVAQWLAAPPPDHFVLIDPDEELRRILLAEISQITNFPATGASVEECALSETLAGAVPLCRPSKTKAVRAVLPAGVELITLPIRSPNAWLNPWLPAPAASLIGIVSHWPEFLTTAQTMLVAAGLSPDVLVLRDAREKRWRHGLDQVTAVLCDAFTATLPKLPAKPHKIVFPLLAETARAELGGYSHRGGL